MALSLTVTPGKQFANGEELDNSKLNLLGTPSVSLVGAAGSAEIGTNVVTGGTTGNIALGTIDENNLKPGDITSGSEGTQAFGGGFLAALYLTQAARPTAGRTNLVVTNNASNGTTKAIITASEISLLDGSGNYWLASAVNVTVDITANGNANGLDTLPGTGAANSTWYYLFIIANVNNNTVQGLISTSRTSPTLPSGFTAFALVGQVYNQAAAAGFNNFRIVGRQAWIQATNAATAATATGSWVAYTTNVGLSIPPNATTAMGSSSSSCNVAGDSGGNYGDPNGTGQFYIPIITAQTIYIKGSGSSNRITFLGYEF